MSWAFDRPPSFIQALQKVMFHVMYLQGKQTALLPDRLPSADRTLLAKAWLAMWTCRWAASSMPCRTLAHCAQGPLATGSSCFMISTSYGGRRTTAVAALLMCCAVSLFKYDLLGSGQPLEAVASFTMACLCSSSGAALITHEACLREAYCIVSCLSGCVTRCLIRLAICP